MAGLKALPAKYSPFASRSPVGSVSFTIGAEASDIKNVAVQLKDSGGNNLAVRGVVRGYLSGDANGDTLLSTPPSGGVAIGTNGVLIPKESLLNDLLVKGTLVIDATAEKFKTTTTAYFTIGGKVLSKAATTALTFTAAHTVTASKFGVILVQINAAGTISTKVPSATQAYNSAPLALAALPSPDAGKVALGYIAIANNTGDWVANTDDLTDGSDLTTATFVDATEYNSVPRAFDITSESNGTIDINITDTGVRTMYLAIVLPDGRLNMSGAITFA